MSRRDELAAVIGEHRYRDLLGDYEIEPFYKHFGCSCGWEQNIAGMSGWRSWTAAHAAHQADAVLAWLGWQLGERDLSDAMVNGIRHAAGDIRQVDESRNDRRGARALDVVREWFGVAE